MFFISFTTIITVIPVMAATAVFPCLGAGTVSSTTAAFGSLDSMGRKNRIGVLHIGSYLCIWLLLERNNSPIRHSCFSMFPLSFICCLCMGRPKRVIQMQRGPF